MGGRIVAQCVANTWLVKIMVMFFLVCLAVLSFNASSGSEHAGTAQHDQRELWLKPAGFLIS